MNRVSILIVLSLAAGCAQKKPPETAPPSSDASLYNEPKPSGTQAQRGADVEKRAEEANIRLARVMTTAIRVGAAIWLSSDERCPTTKDLTAVKFIDEKIPPNDPWGTPFVIGCDKKEPTVTSAGPDQKTGTADDIVSGK